MDDGVDNGGGLKGGFVFAALAVFAAFAKSEIKSTEALKFTVPLLLGEVST